MTSSNVADALGHLRARLAEVAAETGRDPGSITIVAVSKGVDDVRILEAKAAGIRCFGENKVQEGCRKQEALGDAIPEWHLIGPLQANKVNKAVGRFTLLHGIDDADLVRRIGRRASMLGTTQRILLQVNVARDPRKAGLDPEDTRSVVAVARETPGVALEGFMTLAPQDVSEAEVSRAFRDLRRLRDELAPECPILSMGMSGDFELAIREGATHLRIGSGIFGPRPTTQQEAGANHG
ncbi:MAG: YggS family pyridoxal phosphate-dependent enzyme [Candidatus Sericytochromatia bacterium]|nr:YggS family pyridoxal phosphate-dependent enzyme [Candidatus Sericytochromatia bacterium]